PPPKARGGEVLDDGLSPAPQARYPVIPSSRSQASALPLSAPALLTPSNGATGVLKQPTFIWTGVSGANKYWLTVTTSAGAVISIQLTGTSYTPSTPLASGVTYRWTGQAFDDSVSPTHQGQDSATFSFTTQASASMLPAPVLLT